MKFCGFVVVYSFYLLGDFLNSNVNIGTDGAVFGGAITFVRTTIKVRNILFHSDLFDRR